VFGLVALTLAACAPDDSAALQTQTQVANDAFNTRVASVRQDAQSTAIGQDLISALMDLDATATEPVIPAEATLPATASTDIAPPSQPETSLPSLTPAAPNPTEASPAPELLATNTLIPSGTPLAQDAVSATTVPPTVMGSVLASATPDAAVSTLEQPTLLPADEGALTVESSPAPSTTPPLANSEAMQGVTMFAAFDSGMVDHLSTNFASLGQLNVGTVGAIDIDALGNLYVGDTTGVLVFPDICGANALPSGDAFDVDAGIADIQGLDAISAPDRLLVVDSSESAPALVGITRGEAGAPAVLFRTTNLGGRRPWDLDYDAAHDRLYVTTTDGNVLVFDDYFAHGGAVPPSRVITPFDTTGAQQVSLDLRGVVYVPAADALILSDVGGSVDPNDGQLLIIDSASVANGNVPVRAQIRGAKTLLGDPSDIAFDGTSLYVAENLNGFLLRYDNILGQSGILDLEANAISDAPQVRSVTLALQNPGANPVCSPAIAPVPAETISQPTAMPPEADPPQNTVLTQATAVPVFPTPPGVGSG
jgi:hypothetical protein